MSMPNGPLVIFRGTNDFPMYIKVNSYHLQEGIQFIKELHKNSKSEMPFNYHLLENDYDKMNENDHRACWVLSFFSTLALIISGMGIYGLAGFQAETRTREMAIRKVFGARPKNIRLLFYLEFGRFFIIGVLLGWTLAIIVLQKYASNFVYHPNISLKPFFLSGIILAFITFLIVEIQIRLVCIKNAAETLKNE
jgi:putative ABC transport system permease protein